MIITATEIGALGIDDDTLALQSAIDSLEPGDTLLLGPHHNISHLRLGNGSSSQPSTQAGITIRGAGLPGFHSSGAWAGGTTLTRVEGADPTIPMLTVDGPIVAVDLSNIHLDCAGLCEVGFLVNHAQRSKFHGLLVQNYLSCAYAVLAYQSPPNVWNGAADNTWVMCSATGPASDTATAIYIGDDFFGSSPNLDVCRNTFINCWWTAGVNGCAIDIRFADNLEFVGCTTYQGKGLRLQAPTGSNLYPSELSFLHCSLSSGIETIGIHPAAGKVLFWPYQTGDGAAIPTVAGAPTAIGVTTSGRFFGRWRGLPVTLHSSVTTGTVLATSTQETVLGAGYDLPADTLSDQGGVLTVDAAGTVVSPTPGRQLTLRARLGGVQGAVIAERVVTLGTESIAGCGWSLRAQAACRFGGPNGSIVQAGGTVDVGGVVYGSSKSGGVQVVNTRVSQLVVITAQWGTVATDGSNVAIASFRVGYAAAT